MTPIAQLMQVLQTAAPASPNTGAGGETAPVSGLAELFGKLLEEAQGKFMTGQMAEGSEGSVETLTPSPLTETEVLQPEGTEDTKPVQGDTVAIPVANLANLSGTSGEIGQGQANQPHGPPVAPGASGEAPPNLGVTPSGQQPPGLDVATVAKSNERQQAHGQLVAAVAKSNAPSGVAESGRPSAVPGLEVAAAVNDHVAALSGDAQKASPIPTHVLAMKGKEAQEGGIKQAAMAGKPPQPVMQTADDAVAEVPRPGLTLKSLLAESSVQAQLESGEKAAPGNSLLAGTGTESVKAEMFQAKMVEPVNQPQVVPVSDVKVGQVETARGAEASLPRGEPFGRDVETVHVRNIGDFTIKSVKYLSGNSEGTVNVRLVPRNLGELQIAVRSSGGSVEIVVTAASQMVRDVLEVQLAGIRDSLAREGIEVSKVSVQTFTASDSGPGHSAGGNSAQSGHQTRFDAKFAREMEMVEPDRRGSPGMSGTHEGSLDMLV